MTIDGKNVVKTSIFSECSDVLDMTLETQCLAMTSDRVMPFECTNDFGKSKCRSRDFWYRLLISLGDG